MSAGEDTVTDVEWEKNGEDIKYNEVDSVQELEEKKQAHNTFSIENNNVQKQIFIKENTGGIFINFSGNVKRNIADNYAGKKYNLQNEEECIEFVQTYQTGLYLATAIVLSVFKAVYIADLPALQDKMYFFLQENMCKANSIQEDIANPYIAINTILAVMGGQIIDAESNESYVMLEQQSSDVLVYLLKQFPLLHKPIIQFLTFLISEDQYHTKVYCEMIAATLARICAMEILNFQNELAPVLYDNPYRYYLWGRFICELNTQNENIASSFLKKWVKEQGYQNWRNVCFLYIILKENNYSFPYLDVIRDIIRYRIKNGKKADYHFLALLILRSSDITDIVCDTFYELSKIAGSREQMKKWAHSYLYLVQEAYYGINRNRYDLPLVACQNKKQQSNLKIILETIMANYNLRRQIYLILQTYLKELSLYNYDIKTIKHIAAFCKNLSWNDEGYIDEIKELLSNLNKRAANDVATYFI